MGSKRKRRFTVSVRDLVEFALRQGDLMGDRTFVGPTRALEGTRGHQQLQQSRPEGYRAEVPLAYEIERTRFTLRIQGRIDGVMSASVPPWIEEIKTVTHRWKGKPSPLHWAQAKTYGAILSQQNELTQVQIRLTYLNLDTLGVTDFSEQFEASDLASFFDELTHIYLQWLEDFVAWCDARDRSIANLHFPFSSLRHGQEAMILAVDQAVQSGGRLFVEAPTGIGKTLAVLYPSVQALANGRHEKIFYLTARTVGRTVAEKTLNDLRAAGLKVRSVTLTAKEKMCVRDQTPCDCAECPLAIGYYDRIRGAMQAALQVGCLNRAEIERVAQRHQVCPFELSLDVSRWVDVIVCDYNYTFDPQAVLKRYFSEPSGSYLFLVDEAHNLVDRAREMFSAALGEADLQEGKRALKGNRSGCAKELNDLRKTLRALADPDHSEEDHSTHEKDLFDFDQPKLARPSVARGADSDPAVLSELPEPLLQRLRLFVKAAEQWLAHDQSGQGSESVLRLYFKLIGFLRIADLLDDSYRVLLRLKEGIQLQLYCLDPSKLLQKTLQRCRSAIFFSATLSPLDYYRSMLGGDERDVTVQLPSPFPTEHFQVLIHRNIETSYRRRYATRNQVVDSIMTLVKRRQGNYLVYFPSYQYLNDVYDGVTSKLEAPTESAGDVRPIHESISASGPDEGMPPIQTLRQTTAMSESARDDFLAAFRDDHDYTLVGFAVMGGIFGEGIDLVGERLIGAIVVGVGLPQLCVERNLMKEHFEATRHTGFEFAYIIPGMNRVMQAVGRVIRSQSDRGVALLIDTRFRQPQYHGLLPPWWNSLEVRHNEDLARIVDQFWNSNSIQAPQHELQREATRDKRPSNTSP